VRIFRGSIVMESNDSAQEILRRQLATFAQFTSRALGERNIDALMLDACLRARAGISVTHAKLLEYIPKRDRLLLRSGVGWREGYVGQYEIVLDSATPIGHSFIFSEPVAITDYRKIDNYPFPEILREHGCVSSINVPLPTDEGMFGVLEVDHIEPRAFSSDDVNFLTGLGNTIARAIELRRAMQAMASTLDQQQLLLREMNHRIKNNLTLVAGMLHLQARQSSEPAVRDSLTSAVTRINNLALIHDRMQLFTGSMKTISAAAHFQELSDMLRSLLPTGVVLTAKLSGSIPGDHVAAITLIANELITNAAKYAFSERQDGEITLGYQEEGVGWRLWVHDNGSGLPSLSSARSTSFGGRLVETLAMQLNAQVKSVSEGGTKVDVICGLPLG
jgi:two-component sensor histidine kinase